MKIIIIADARSEHTRRWVGYLSARDDVLLLSTHPFHGKILGVKIVNLPKLFSAGNSITKGPQDRTSKRSTLAFLVIQFILKFPIIWHLWQRLNLIEVVFQGQAARKMVIAFQPHVVHAMRIQNEGYIGAIACWHPFVISVMGSDFVYTAKHSVLHRVFTKKVIPQCDGMMADCDRDLRLAVDFGLKQSAIREYFPGNGGVDLDVFSPGLDQKFRTQEILYFRGISPLYRPITLIKAVSALAQKVEYSNIVLHVLAPIASVAWFDEKRSEYGLPEKNFKVGGFLPTKDLAALLQSAVIVVSPTISDGTPNSMLEAMACGALPVVSNLESNREWITDGINGFTFDPENVQELADKIARGLENISLRQNAQFMNYKIVRERADYNKVMPTVRQFYQRLAGS